MDDSRDDGIPIRRHTKRVTRRPTRTPLIVAVVVGSVVVLAVVTLLASGRGTRGGGDPSRDHRGVADTDTGIGPFGLLPNLGGGRYPEGERLLKYSTWWTTGATAAKVQAIVDDMTKNAVVSIVFTSDADYTRVKGFPEYARRSNGHIPSTTANWRDGTVANGVFELMWIYAHVRPDAVPNRDVIWAGERLQLRAVDVINPNGERDTVAKAASRIEDALANAIIPETGRPIRPQVKIGAKRLPLEK